MLRRPPSRHLCRAIRESSAALLGSCIGLVRASRRECPFSIDGGATIFDGRAPDSRVRRSGMRARGVCSISILAHLQANGPAGRAVHLMMMRTAESELQRGGGEPEFEPPPSERRDTLRPRRCRLIVYGSTLKMKSYSAKLPYLGFGGSATSCMLPRAFANVPVPPMIARVLLAVS